MWGEIFSETRTYNLVLANLYGINASVYISVLLEFYTRNGIENCPCKICRDTIRNNSGLTEAAQKDAQEILESVGIIQSHSSSEYITINMPTLFSKFNLNSNEAAQEKSISKISTQLSKAQTKQAIIIAKIKRTVIHTTLENDGLYEDLIDTLFDKYGKMTIAQFNQIQNKLTDYVKGDNIKLNIILGIAITMANKDITKAITQYEALYPSHNETEEYVRNEPKNVKDIIF